MRLRPRLLVPVIALLGSGCYGTSADTGDNGAGASGGSTSSGGSGSTAYETCGLDRYVLAGTVDSEALNASGMLDGHAWLQGSDPSTLDTPFAEGGSFHAEWPGVVADNASTEITGFVVLPPGSAYSGQALNFVSGTMTKYDSGVSFLLGDLSVSVACITDPCPNDGVSGTIDGCIHW